MPESAHHYLYEFFFIPVSVLFSIDQITSFAFEDSYKAISLASIQKLPQSTKN